MARPITKERVTLTIDKNVVLEMSKFAKILGTTKSGFIETLIKEALVTTNQLFNTSDSLAEAVVILSKQLKEVNDLMKDPRYQEIKQNMEVIKNGLHSNHNQTKE